MNKTTCASPRVEKLPAMLAAYRPTTMGKTERPSSGEVQSEIEEELWRLEQELYDPRLRRQI